MLSSGTCAGKRLVVAHWLSRSLRGVRYGWLTDLNSFRRQCFRRFAG
jgi:hypothetical protein